MTSLELYWNKYVNKKFFRVIAAQDSKVLKIGLNPNQNPHHNIIPSIKQLFHLFGILERKGFVHTQNWGSQKNLQHIKRVTLRDISSPFIDLTPDKKEILYYLSKPGGALVSCIKNMLNDLQKWQPALNMKEQTVVKKLTIWTNQRSKDKNLVLSISPPCKALQTAHFQRMGTKNPYSKYWISPIGPFPYFQKVIKKFGLQRYDPYLKGNKLYNLRLIQTVPANQIKLEK